MTYHSVRTFGILLHTHTKKDDEKGHSVIKFFNMFRIFFNLVYI